MASESFLTVNSCPISLAQALTYLQTSGKLNNLIGDILRQYVIEQELETRKDIEISPGVLEQTIIDFRLQRQLSEPKVFQEWLARNGTDYATFHKQTAYSLKLENLKTKIAEPKLQEYFIERKIFLDRVVLSRIIVDSKELAEELHSQLEEGTAFDDLAREYSLAEERIVNGMMGAIGRGTLPDKMRAAIDSASPRDIVGPLEISGRWGLLRVENFLPASLEDVQLQQILKNELFSRWVTEKIQKLTVKLQVN